MYIAPTAFPTNFRVDMETLADGTNLISPCGDLDMATSPLLERRLVKAEAASPPCVFVDLRGVEFMDSSGLQILVAARKRANRADYELVLLRGQDGVQRLFELTGTLDLFTFGDA